MTHQTPFKVRIKDGYLEDFENPEEIPKTFQDVIKIIKENEGNVIVREFGLGLNKAMGKYPIAFSNFSNFSDFADFRILRKKI